MVIATKVKKILCKKCQAITKHDFHHMPRVGYCWICKECDTVVKQEEKNEV